MEREKKEQIERDEKKEDKRFKKLEQEEEIRQQQWHAKVRFPSNI